MLSSLPVRVVLPGLVRGSVVGGSLLPASGNGSVGDVCGAGFLRLSKMMDGKEFR